MKLVTALLLLATCIAAPAQALEIHYSEQEEFVERDPVLEQRAWALLEALHHSDHDAFLAAATETVDGERPERTDRYTEFRNEFRPLTRYGAKIVARHCVRIKATGNHWYRFQMLTERGSHLSLVVSYMVDLPGRPIANIAVNSRSKQGPTLDPEADFRLLPPR